MLAWLYRKLWKPTAGRPWTYAMREYATRKPGILLVIGFGLGEVVANSLRWQTEVWLWAALFAGALFGHLFWDTRGKFIKHRKDFDH